MNVSCTASTPTQQEGGSSLEAHATLDSLPCASSCTQQLFADITPHRLLRLFRTEWMRLSDRSMPRKGTCLAAHGIEGDSAAHASGLSVCQADHPKGSALPRRRLLLSSGGIRENEDPKQAALSPPASREQGHDDQIPSNLADRVQDSSTACFSLSPGAASGISKEDNRSQERIHSSATCADVLELHAERGDVREVAYAKLGRQELRNRPEDQRPNPVVWRKLPRVHSDIETTPDKACLRRTGGPEDPISEVSASARDSPLNSTPQASSGSRGPRSLRRVLSLGLASPSQAGKSVAGFLGSARSADSREDSLSLSFSASRVLRGGSRVQVEPGGTEKTPVKEAEAQGQPVASSEDEKHSAAHGGRVLSNMMSMLKSRGVNSSAESTGASGQPRDEGMSWRHQPDRAELSASPSAKLKGAGLSARFQRHRADGASRCASRKHISATATPAIHCSAVAPAMPVLVQQPVAPSMPVVSAEVQSSNAASGETAQTNLAPAAAPVAAFAVVPASSSVAGSIILSPPAPAGGEGSSGDAPLMYSLGTDQPGEGRGGRGGLRRRADGRVREVAGMWDGFLQQLQDMLLGVLLLVVLCSLFFGKISAVVTTLLVGLLASRLLLPLPPPGVQTAHGSGGSEGIAESSSGNTTDGSDSSGTEKVASRGRRMPTRDPDAVRRQQQIARIMQYSQTSDPKANAVLEGLLTGPGRPRGRR